MNEQFIVDESGKPTAGILPIDDYKKILSALEERGENEETLMLSQLPEFEKLVLKGLEDVKYGRVRYWKEIWDEL